MSVADIYIYIYIYVGQTGEQLKERYSVFTDNKVERHWHTYAKGMFKILSFFKMKKNTLREC